MVVMTVADTHGKLTRNEVADFKSMKDVPDIIFCLGDMSYNDYGVLEDIVKEWCEERNASMPVFCGVLGNHDKNTLMDEITEDMPDFIALDKNRLIAVKGFVIGGVSGSVKYKDDDFYCIKTQEEMLKELEKLCDVDILICHSQPAFDKSVFKNVDENGISLNAHDGIYAIGKYIDEHKPRFVFHGHLHDRKSAVRGNTMIHCCYGIQVFNI